MKLPKKKYEITKVEKSKNYKNEPIVYIIVKLTNKSKEKENIFSSLVEGCTIQQDTGDTTEDLPSAYIDEEKSPYKNQIKMSHKDLKPGKTVEAALALQLVDENSPLIFEFVNGEYEEIGTETIDINNGSAINETNSISSSSSSEKKITASSTKKEKKSNKNRKKSSNKKKSSKKKSIFDNQTPPETGNADLDSKISELSQQYDELTKRANAFAKDPSSFTEDAKLQFLQDESTTIATFNEVTEQLDTLDNDDTSSKSMKVLIYIQNKNSDLLEAVSKLPEE
ncbi:DUF5067 domain-containing protein [Enterococcus sp. AZ103]|uniref:DUF5067 domain-containing protein n=1 Tax=Enterococcus sp. AZ103 TaxID=2774628 RepID=UPI003F683782